MLFSLLVLAAFAEYSVSAEYSADTFGRNQLWADSNWIAQKNVSVCHHFDLFA
jgi:hypothetical protein